MLTYLRRLTDERDSLTQTATSVTDRAAAEDRDLTDTERASLTQMQTRCAEIDSQLVTYNEQAESMRAYASLRSRLSSDDDHDDAPPPAARTGAPALETRSWGQIVTESDAFRTYDGHGRTSPIQVPLELRSSSSPRLASDVIMTSNLPIPPHIFTPNDWVRISAFLDVISTERVSSGNVEWIYWPPPDPVAQVVAEGAVKPFADIPSVPKSSTLNTYAHAKVITRQALEDYPRIQSIIETRLRNGLVAALEAAVANAVETDINIPPAASAAGGTLLEAIRLGVGVVQANGYKPNAVLLHPNDWANIDINVMGVAGLPPTGASSFWGLVPVSAPDITVGKAYVGDFKEGVTLFDRGVANVFMSDSHADIFLRNELVILAETRAVPEVTTPLAMAQCTATAGP
jgi:HK97 family phage major capsid protein